MELYICFNPESIREYTNYNECISVVDYHSQINKATVSAPKREVSLFFDHILLGSDSEFSIFTTNRKSSDLFPMLKLLSPLSQTKVPLRI